MEQNEPIRVAQIIGKWVGGGVEAVVMNYYRHIDHSKIQFDFFCDEDSTNIPYEEIEKYGGRVILIPPYQKIFKYQKELINLLKDGKYKIVHSNINALSIFPLRAAKKAGVKIRIAHSHSTSNPKEWKKNIIKNILRPFSKVYASHFFACTEHAAKWLFNNDIIHNNNYYHINNAIELEKFAINNEYRVEIRNELNIPFDYKVFGHIGRFVPQKNHSELIDIFNEIYKIENDSVLLLVGEGPLYNEINDKVKELGLEEHVKFVGQRADINKLYQAFDYFLFPSLYEGLGMVLIEAQCSGLKCFCSNNIPNEARVTNNIEFLKLNNVGLWTKKIAENLEYERENYIQEIKECGFDINNESKKLEEIYMELIKNEE